jgi:acyl-CoA thioesterase
VVLEGKKPHDHPLAPAADAPWHYKLLKENPGMQDVFPGLEVRKVDMRPFNKNRPLMAYRQLQFYRMIAPPGKANGKENTNLHACAHLYASDRNSLFLISNALGVGERVKKMGSLSHSVVFHVGSKELLFCDAEERAKRAEVTDSRESQWSEEDSTWFCQEAWTPRTEGGRGIHESKIWDSRGVHVASSWQDGLVRTWPEGSEAKGPQHITDSPRREDGRGIKGKL